MRCPKCQYEPTPEEQSSSKGQCPSCGIFYEKYIAQLKAKLAGESAINVVTPVKAAPYKPSIQTPDAQPVVVVDIQMRFWSMVVFMVKWAFAAIPALIIIGLIVTALTMFFTGFISGTNSSSKATNYKSSLDNSIGNRTDTKQKPLASKPAQAELISATLIDKGFSEGKYQKSNTFKMNFENKTGRDIRAFEGIVVLSDLLGNVITRVKLSENEPNWVADKLLWSGSIDYNQFMSKDQELKNASLDSLKMSFEIKKILYKDGELQEF